MKIFTWLIFFAFLIAGTAAAPWSFSSSNYNRDLADREYSNSPVERWVARSFGDELPNMRSDLIERKNNGEGFFRRHYNAWTTGGNWRRDPMNDWMERNT